MQLQTWRTQNTLVLQVQGRLDAYTCDQLKQLWQNSPDDKSFVVDLSQTQFLDSMGLATLVTGLKVARKRGGSLSLVNPSSAIHIILDLTGMIHVFDVFPTVDEALSSVIDT
jgi:anti-anti-sigma factor